MPDASIEQNAFGNRRFQQYLQAPGARKKLRLVGTMGFWAITYVLDRMGITVVMNFDDINDAG